MDNDLKTTENDLTRISNDSNGNPRYVVHYLALSNCYQTAIKIGNSGGGRKFNNKQYGGGIVFQSYDPKGLVEWINENSENNS